MVLATKSWGLEVACSTRRGLGKLSLSSYNKAGYASEIMLITLDGIDYLYRKKRWREGKKWREGNGDGREMVKEKGGDGERPAEETVVGASLGFVSSPYLDSSQGYHPGLRSLLVSQAT